MEFLVLLSYKTERPYNSKSVTIPTFDESRWLAGEPNCWKAEWLDGYPNNRMGGCVR